MSDELKPPNIWLLLAKTILIAIGVFSITIACIAAFNEHYDEATFKLVAGMILIRVTVE